MPNTGNKHKIPWQKRKKYMISILRKEKKKGVVKEGGLTNGIEDEKCEEYSKWRNKDRNLTQREWMKKKKRYTNAGNDKQITFYTLE